MVTANYTNFANCYAGQIETATSTNLKIVTALAN